MAQQSKSGVKAESLLKAGHPPAVKAGGKRVAKKGLEENATPEKESKRLDKPRSLASTNRVHQVSILLAGPLDKLVHDFPETPVSVRHSKVRPAVEKSHTHRTLLIQQPKKF